MLNISYPKALSVIGFVITTTAATLWYARSDYIEQLKDRIDSYEKSAEWQLPETVKKLNVVATNLELTLDERDRLNKAEQKLGELSAENIDMKEKLNKKTAELMEAIRMIDTLTAKEDSFNLFVGESHSLIKNEVVIGLKHLLPNRGSFLFKNLDLDLYVGEYKEYGFGNKKCKVLLSKVEYKTGSVWLTNNCSE